MSEASSDPGFRPCAVIPTYDNPQTIRDVVVAVREHLDDVLVVDDGGGDAARAVLSALAAEALARVRRREVNGGKGAAVKTGLAWAHELGFTHALQIDADGQHEAARIPAFLEAARAQPTALVLGYPVYDRTVPRGRLLARQITTFFVALETAGRRVRDAMVGFRVYPLAAARRVRARGDRMDFDIEIAVRLAWTRMPIVNLPVTVRYLEADEGGVSHFRLWRDNVGITWLHTRLCTLAILRGLGRLLSFWRRP